MARPQKDGLDYFPLDVDMDQDDKIALIEAEHGLEGFAIVIKLLMKIYRNSYFYEWTKKEQLLFSKRINVDINSINVIINNCIEWELFDKGMLETHNILTSKGIQRRYLEASKRRQKVEIEEKYLLLDENEVNAYKNIVVIGVNVTETIVNVDINPQRKVKESKVKESKVNNNNSSFVEVVKYFEKCGFRLTPLQFDEIKADIEIYTEVWLKDAAKESSNRGKLNYSYVRGILSNWLAKGKKEGEVNGKPKQNTESADREGIGFEL